MMMMVMVMTSSHLWPVDPPYWLVVDVKAVKWQASMVHHISVRCRDGHTLRPAVDHQDTKEAALKLHLALGLGSGMGEDGDMRQGKRPLGGWQHGEEVLGVYFSISMMKTPLPLP